MISIQEAAAGNDLIVHQVLGGVMLAGILGGIKVWADQRSDQRAARHEKVNRLQIDTHVNERISALETRTAESMLLKPQVEQLALSTEHVRKISEESSSILHYLKGRADQADADVRRRRSSDP